MAALIGLMLAAAVLWWAETASDGQPGSGSTNTTRQDPSAVGGYLAPAVAADDPVASAVAWLQATRSLSFADETPTRWIGRARPVVTDRLAANYDRLRDGGAGAEWPDFVAAGCVSIVTDAAASSLWRPRVPRIW